MAVRFIDTNVLLRALTGTSPDQAAAARALLFRVEAGLERVTTSPLVLFEVIFTLHSARSYNHPKERVVELVSPVIELRGLQLPNKQLWLDAFALWLAHSIDFADAFNVASMRTHGITEIYTWDKGYSHVSDITCIEPTWTREEEAA
jgi:predicted nucleic acid-binding protein